jgi:ABC-type glycerol-3-phosphate transport system substrate-binding protein
MAIPARARPRSAPKLGILLACFGLIVAACSGSTATTAPTQAAGASPAAGVSSAPNPTTAPSAAPVTITFGAFATPSLTKDVWAGIVASFQAKNPDVTVNTVYPPSTEADVSAYWKSLLASGKEPDVITDINPGDFIKAGALYNYPLTDPDVQQIPDASSLTVGGKLYTLGTMLQPLSLIYYNKDLFTAAGVAQPPTTVADFTAALQALKDKGTTPFLTAGDSTAYIQWNALTSADVFGQDPHWFTDRRAGTVHYADPTGPNLAWAMTISDWAKKGFFSKGASGLTYAQATQDFIDGKGGVIANGVWFAGQVAGSTPTFQTGLFASPTADGQKQIASLQDGFCSVWAGTQHSDAAVRLCKFINFDAQGHGVLMAKDGDLSALKSPPPFTKSPLQQAAADLLTSGYTTTSMTNGIGDEVAVPGLQDAITSAWQALLIGQDPTKVMKDLDTYWDQKQQAGG